MQEENLQIAVCTYLKLQYPKVLFNSDLSGIRLTINQATRVKKMRSGRAWPDIFIAEPKGKYSGLFIEIKTQNIKLFKKDGITPKSKHIIEQSNMIIELSLKGYAAVFAIGFDQAKKIIDEYLKI